MSGFSLLLQKKIKGYYKFYELIRIEKSLNTIDKLKQIAEKRRERLYKEDYGMILSRLVSQLDYQEIDRLYPDSLFPFNEAVDPHYYPFDMIKRILSTIIHGFRHYSYSDEIKNVMKITTFLKVKSNKSVIRKLRQIFGVRFRDFFYYDDTHSRGWVIYIDFGIKLNPNFDSHIAHYKDSIKR